MSQNDRGHIEVLIFSIEFFSVFKRKKRFVNEIESIHTVYYHLNKSKTIKIIFDKQKVVKFLETTVIVYLILKIKISVSYVSVCRRVLCNYAKFCIIFKTAENATSCAVMHGFNVVCIFRWNFLFCNIKS